MLLVIDRRDSSLEISGNSLIIRIDGIRQSPVPLKLLTHVIIVRKTQLSSSVLTRLASEQTTVTILGGRFQEQPVAVIGLHATLANTRRAQYAASLDTAQQLKICKVLINAKTRRQIRLLERISSHRPDKRYTLNKALQQQRNSILTARAAATVVSLRGTEGANAAAHFEALSSVFPPALEFRKRQRRPPPDPVNVLLSLTYTIIHHTATSVAHQVGFDPLCGYLHDPLHGRNSLAADLTELLRADAEEFVWRTLRTATLSQEHFSQTEKGCSLGKAGRGIFYHLISAHKPYWEKALKHQAKRLRYYLEKPTK